MKVFATHVKELSAAERHKMLIPMPLAYPELNDVITQAKERLHACGVLTAPTLDVTRNLYAVARVSAETLLDLATHIESASVEERAMWDRIFCYGKNHHTVLNDGTIERNLDYGAYYRRMMVSQETLLRVVANSDQSNPELHPVTISGQASNLMVDIGRSLDDHASYRAALIFVAAADGYVSGEVCIKDLDFIAANIDAVEANLLEEILRRGSTEHALVNELLSVEPALSEGTL